MNDYYSDRPSLTSSSKKKSCKLNKDRQMKPLSYMLIWKFFEVLKLRKDKVKHEDFGLLF